ncbi:protein kinase domain-containing protein, partial [Desertihabitans aurantiacus]|uniref:protein kinase domain-containing protein n=1 Tax=Desertihabitans aurantiacus TaxID=2282477 RepID=UPI0038BCBBED
MAGQQPAMPHAGGWLGRHLLTDLLHQTAHRSIFRAVEDGDGRVGLLLVLDPRLSAVPHLPAVFDARMRQAAGVLERHVVALRHWDETDGLLHAELGVVAGTGLRTLLEHEPMPVPHALDLAARLADALEAAHARGLPHLGMSPSTVVVDPQGRPVLTDLGVAAALVQAGVRPDPDEARWVAPEVLDGALAGGWTPRAGQRADVWSLAALLHDCLTGLGAAARPL